MSNDSKKTKTMSETEEISALESYLNQCNVVAKDSRILQVALAALGQERQRLERDAKLQRKFSKTASVTATTTNGTNKTTGSTLTKTFISQTKDDDCEDDELMEWQDVNQVHPEIDNTDNTLGSSILGRQLAQAAIAKMAQADVHVNTPLGALALALHAALSSDLLQFSCTGIPEINQPVSSGNSGGFAPPIRQLPKTQLVPSDWEQCAQSNVKFVAFRYRKTGVGTVVLKLSLFEEDQVKVELTPTKSKEPAPTPLQLGLDDHVNLESLAKALSSETAKRTNGTLPALHYKSLAVLLTNFCNTFDLGPIQEEQPQGDDVSNVVPALSTSTRLPYVDATIVEPPQPNSFDPLRVPTRLPNREGRTYDPHATPTIRLFQPDRKSGDFSGDLTPMGVDPFRSGGNLMGPNHPAFTGGGGMGPDPGMIGGGFGMQPRYDPIGPPGGPQDVPPNGKPKGRRPPPGGPGDPNPDLQRPPNDLGNNMFL